jgi:lipoyl(octanoyl) transferase
MQEITVRDLGRIRYKEAWDYQESLFKKAVETKLHNRDKAEEELLPVKHYFLFCEHNPVYTLGKSGHFENLLANNTELNERGIEFFKTNRGGDITFHGPGQIVGYPILDLDHFFTDIHKYMRLLEEMVILTLAEYGIEAGRLKEATGVWLEPENPFKARKICAMGVRCSRWVTMHGFAFNINTDLSYFELIVPCGITDKSVTSLQKELGHEVDMEEVKAKLTRHFSTLFDAKMVWGPEAAIHR